MAGPPTAGRAFSGAETRAIKLRNENTYLDQQREATAAKTRTQEATHAAGLTRAESAASLAEREAANNRAMDAARSFYTQTGGGTVANGTGSGGGPLPPRIGLEAGGGGGSGQPLAPQGSNGPSPATLSSSPIAGSEGAARSAAFGRAKEQAGQSAQASLAGLRNALSRRGINSGGYANMQTAEALMPAADQLQDFSREQMISDFNREGQIADRDVQTGLSRRGQDITQRGQDISAAQAHQQSLLGLFNAGRLY